MRVDLNGQSDLDSLSALRRRCHENSIESYRAFARTTPRGRIEERDGLALIDCHAKDSMGNVAVVTTPSLDPERSVGEAEAFFAQERLPWFLLALPEAASSLERATTTRGFRDEGWFPGLLLQPIPETLPSQPEGLEVRRVDTLQELATFECAASRAYEVPSGPVYGGWLTYPGFSFYLAYHRGAPVATATLVASHGLAGIVYVGTVPEARRKGFGRAVVYAAIDAGRRLGLAASALWATPGGLAMYETMGFRPVTRYRIWSPECSPLPRAFRSPK
jgi:GNAT superfamily N-acetyltransferase